MSIDSVDVIERTLSIIEMTRVLAQLMFSRG